ncbi:MAG: hypothetical protein VKO64_00235 [Candidatus Sericytochromatia bacterium]|nr:hypothetical protein [Candidatus Sericytochromatia bacterium]
MDQQPPSVTSGSAPAGSSPADSSSGLVVNPALAATPLGKASTILRNLFVKPTAEAIADAAAAVADAARQVAHEPTAPLAQPPGGDPSPPPQEPSALPPRATGPGNGGARRGSTQPLRTDELSLGLRKDAVSASDYSRTDSAQGAAMQDAAWLQMQAAASAGRMATLRRAVSSGFGKLSLEERQDLYRLLTEERTYRQAVLAQLDQELRTALRDRRVPTMLADIRARMQQHTAVQAQIFQHLKALTGRSGATGGTGYLGKGKPKGP